LIENLSNEPLSAGGTEKSVEVFAAGIFVSDAPEPWEDIEPNIA
jgi:hypothetical protein